MERLVKIYIEIFSEIVSPSRGQTGIDMPPNHGIKEMRTQND